MRKALIGALLLLGPATQAQPLPPLPAPPPVIPQKEKGKTTPFDPNQIRESTPQPEIRIPRSDEVPHSGEWTLRQLFELALTRQPDILTARAQLLSSEGSTEEQRSNLLPHLSITSQYTHKSATQQGTAVSLPITTTDQLSNGAGLNQLLFDFGHTRALVHQADLKQQAAAANVLQSANDLALTVKQRFYAFLLDQRLVKVIEDDLANRQEQLRLARALYQAGGTSPGDVVRAQTNVSNSVFALNNARRTLELARQDLSQSLGLPPRTPLQLVQKDEPDLPHKDLAYLAQQAAKQRPDLLVASRNVQAGEAGLAAAHTTNYPSLSSFVGVTYSGLSNGVQVPAFTLQLALNFDLYDGGFRAGAVKIAQGQLNVFLAELRRTELGVDREVSGGLEDLLTAERNVEAARNAVDSARQGVRIASGRYQAALGTLTDVFDAQSSLVSAQTNLATSYNALNNARAQLRHSMAAPFEENYEAVESTPPAWVPSNKIPAEESVGPKSANPSPKEGPVKRTEDEQPPLAPVAPVVSPH